MSVSHVSTKSASSSASNTSKVSYADMAKKSPVQTARVAEPVTPKAAPPVTASPAVKARNSPAKSSSGTSSTDIDPAKWISPLQTMTPSDKLALLNGPQVSIKWSNWGKQLFVKGISRKMIAKFSGHARVWFHNALTDHTKMASVIDLGRVDLQHDAVTEVIKRMEAICNAEEPMKLSPVVPGNFLMTLYLYKVIRTLNINNTVSRARAKIFDHVRENILSIPEMAFLWDHYATNDAALVNHMLFRVAIMNLQDQLPDEQAFADWVDARDDDFANRLESAIRTARDFLARKAFNEKKQAEHAQRQAEWLAKAPERAAKREADHQGFLVREARRARRREFEAERERKMKEAEERRAYFRARDEEAARRKKEKLEDARNGLCALPAGAHL
ncbi:hypothetical protein K490DRAFT_52915 [Saccharata proteae CBS 121410]|uniref:Uncharacterized protein n=1 Tax=Saccharata proteae CBS 121410 TaxID=1314787 RepID=A0A9P4I4M5_9PEZI|nr:hypothetical protein K490DRAFT_52915 [Saccharata proteae CBS 121410]